MELLSSKILILSAQNKFPATYSNNPFHFQKFPLVLRSKKSIYQDFQGYAKPIRLLSATEAKSVTDTLYEKMMASFKSGETESLYKVKLQTSNIRGSSLTDLNSSVLLCLIDENGSSILQRLPAVENKNLSANDDMDDILHFQRGLADEFVFEGPSLGNIVAVWISLESGQWRTGGISLRMFCQSQLLSENGQNREQYIGFQYNFEVEDILLGEKSGISLMEFRPYSVTKLSEDEFNLFLEKTVQPSSTLESHLISNEESMKEYWDLKFSLLFYDAVLILTGSSIISIMTGNDDSYAFLIGGTCGFLYLLLLQRSVDGLQVQELTPGEEKVSFPQILERLKGMSLSLVLVCAFAAIAVKYASGDGGVQWTPKDIIIGLMGFLVCKVAVVLAAFKPLPFGLRESK
ncbi:uncharacterized protein [Primulina huaijiensis]|uniref:uncharacterized protein isoform X1 n=2 Tax=Primulina huaijiensis TaxID=1492673 RepID=UPI003CC7088A